MCRIISFANKAFANKALIPLVTFFLLAPVGLDQALAASEAQYLDVCDKAIASRQRVPELYRRTSYTFSRYVLTREEQAGIMREHGVKEEFFKKAMSEFDAGTFTPTDIKVIIDFEATDKTATIVQKRSLCEMRENRASDTPSTDLVDVDGDPQMFWKAED